MYMVMITLHITRRIASGDSDMEAVTMCEDDPSLDLSEIYCTLCYP